MVRLKGGDPFVFGRGGEELAFCEAAGLAVDVVPGVTAATVCAAGVGLPLTLRGVASAVTFVTGHHAGSGTEPDWAALAALDHTLVIYMGVAAARDRLGPPAAGVGRDDAPALAARLAARYGGADGHALLDAMIRREFPRRLAVVASFGTQSAVLLDLVARIDRRRR